MAKFSGTLTLDEDGVISVKMQIAPQNPELYDIPLEEVLEDFIGKRVSMEVLPLSPKWKQEK
jgi:hypothetical protein